MRRNITIVIVNSMQRLIPFSFMTVMLVSSDVFFISTTYLLLSHLHLALRALTPPPDHTLTQSERQQNFCSRITPLENQAPRTTAERLNPAPHPHKH